MNSVGHHGWEIMPSCQYLRVWQDPGLSNTVRPKERERKVDARGMVQKGKQNENGSLQEEGKTKGQRLEGWGPDGLVKMGSRPHKGVMIKAYVGPDVEFLMNYRN